jgi:hypothetical protein
MRSGVRCADTTVTSTPTPKLSSVSAAARIVGRSLSLPMMIPTETGKDASSASEPEPPSARAMTRSSLLSASAAWFPVTVRCPIFRPFRESGLSYQWTFAPGTRSAAPMTSCIRCIASGPSPSPRMFFITAPPTRRSVSPSGHPRIARTCDWYWQHAHASMV